MTMLRRTPIKVKLTLIILISSSLSLLLAAFGYLWLDSSAFRSRMATNMSSEADVIGTNCAAALSFSDKSAAIDVLKSLKARKDIDSAALYRPDGSLFVEYWSSTAGRKWIPANAKREDLNVDSNGISVRRLIRLDNDVVGTLFMRSNMHGWTEQRNRFVLLISLLTIACGLVACGVGSRLQRVISGPITELTEAMRTVADREEYGLRVVQRSEDEVGELVSGFNFMLSEIEHEILDRKAAQEQVVRSQRSLQDFFENATVGLHQLGPDGTILSANRTELNMLGYSAEEYVGHNVEEFHQDKQAKAEFLAELASGKDVVALETGMLCKDGSILQVAIDSSVLWEDGVFVHTRSFTRDLTAQREAERAMLGREQADRANAAKSEFLSRMSHELRTPMNAIMGFTQLLGMDDLTADQQDSVERIMKAGRHLLKLINEVLDISRIESGTLAISSEAVCVAEVVSEVMSLAEPIAELKQVKMDNAVVADDQVHVLADRQRLTQVLLNLISNAIKYNVELGAVRVETLALTAAVVRIIVTDTGPGIPSDKASLMFMPFERLGAEYSATEGTGLGLAVSKRLVEAMGGEIGILICDSGACFYVDLPSAANPMLAAGEAVVTGQRSLGQGHSGTLLLVEDNPSNVRVMEKALSRRPDLKLVHAHTGELALSLALTHVPDLVLLDLNLPDLDGGQVLAELRANKSTAHIPVIVVSADATARQMNRLRAAGAFDYITKPIDIEKLFSAIDACLTAEAKLIA